MARRRRRRGGPRCRDCGRPVVFFKSAVRREGQAAKWRPFEPAPVDRGGAEQRIAYPVENGVTWWDPRYLVEDLMERYEHTRGDAEREANDMPWYAPHLCANHTPPIEEDQLHADDQPGTGRHEDDDGPLARRRQLAGAGGRW